MPIPAVQQNAVFLNIPYDARFSRLYLAYIVGLTELGLEPRATLGIPGGERRLNRILALIQSCRYSIHDLSRIEIDRNPPQTPRFNMPFELGNDNHLASAQSGSSHLVCLRVEQSPPPKIAE